MAFAMLLLFLGPNLVASQGPVADSCDSYSAPAAQRMLAVTSEYLSAESEYNNACADEFGAGSHIADWDCDILTRSQAEIEALISGQDITLLGEHYLVTRGGDACQSADVCQSGDRRYFFQRHDGNPPSNWLVFAQHGGLTLGSWYGLDWLVLCTDPVNSGGNGNTNTNNNGGNTNANTGGTTATTEEVSVVTTTIVASLDFDPAAETSKRAAFKFGVVTTLNLPSGVSSTDVTLQFNQGSEHRRRLQTEYDIVTTIRLRQGVSAATMETRVRAVTSANLQANVRSAFTTAGLPEPTLTVSSISAPSTVTTMEIVGTEPEDSTYDSRASVPRLGCAACVVAMAISR